MTTITSPIRRKDLSQSHQDGTQGSTATILAFSILPHISTKRVLSAILEGTVHEGRGQREKERDLSHGGIV